MAAEADSILAKMSSAGRALFSCTQVDACCSRPILSRELFKLGRFSEVRIVFAGPHKICGSLMAQTLNAVARAADSRSSDCCCDSRLRDTGHGSRHRAEL
jgi:hypothetical protein